MFLLLMDGSPLMLEGARNSTVVPSIGFRVSDPPGSDIGSRIAFDWRLIGIDMPRISTIGAVRHIRRFKAIFTVKMILIVLVNLPALHCFVISSYVQCAKLSDCGFS